MEDKLKEYILKELSKESFLNDVNDVCFLTQDEINRAVEKGIENFTSQLK
jgi:hypothetical protein